MRLDNEVIDALKSIRVDGNKTTMPQFNRALYVRVNKALELLGGKWNRGAKAHVWDGDPGDPIADAVSTGEVRDWRKELQFFPTPPDTAAWLVSLAGIEPNHVILEPSAGNGALVKAIRDAHGSKPHIVALDIDMKMVDGLNRDNQCQAVFCADFLTIERELDDFDRIVMNPPFTKGQDIAHVMHAWQLLKPGGRLVAITSPGWTFRTDAKHAAFKKWFYKVSATQYDLPEGTFKESGTGIRTVAIRATK